jgi:hypothetical protein
MHRLPSRTFVRTSEPNFDVLDFPKHQHPRLTIELHASASLFVGGGSWEGHLRIVVDDLEAHTTSAAARYITYLNRPYRRRRNVKLEAKYIVKSGY